MQMFIGAHTIIESSDADADRAFFRDVLGLESVDVGGGWLIFALPPGELAVHPGEGGKHELYLMCADLDATLAELRRKGVRIGAEIHDERWGRLATMTLPGGGELSIYQPRHASPPHR
jgi:catechol 2,3-dioxygenase-like lactoylglutathione lyase family enzyme